MNISDDNPSQTFELRAFQTSSRLVKALDTKDLVLKTLIAHLQIQGMARELTPYFETADAGLTDAGKAVLDDETEATGSGLPME